MVKSANLHYVTYLINGEFWQPTLRSTQTNQLNIKVSQSTPCYIRSYVYTDESRSCLSIMCSCKGQETGSGVIFPTLTPLSPTLHHEQSCCQNKLAKTTCQNFIYYMWSKCMSQQNQLINPTSKQVMKKVLAYLPCSF